MANDPEFAGHLSRGSDGAYTGLLTDGKGLPIHLTAEVCDGLSGRYFRLIGMRRKKPAEQTIAPWEIPSESASFSLRQATPHPTQPSVQKAGRPAK